jgi:hypothetical protein
MESVAHRHTRKTLDVIERSLLQLANLPPIIIRNNT